MNYFPPQSPGPFIVYVVMLIIPLSILGIYLAFKDGLIGTKTRSQRVMLTVFFAIDIWYVALHAYLHFVLPYSMTY